MQLEKNLNDFQRMLNSPEAMPDVAQGVYFMAPFLKFGSWLTIILGLVAFVFLVIRIACDIAIVAGGVDFVGTDSKVGTKVTAFSSFKNSEKGVSSNGAEYIKDYLWKHMFTIVFIGIMSSGSLLPIAGNVMGGAGSFVVYAANLNVKGAVEHAFDSIETAGKRLKDATGREFDLEYRTAVSDLKTAYDNATRAGGKEEHIRNQAVYIYAMQWHYTRGLAEYINSLKSSETADNTLKSINTQAHSIYANTTLINEGVRLGGDGIFPPITQWESVRDNLAARGN